MTDLIREVEEELRREDAAKLWSRYGKYAIAAAVAVVVGVAGFQAWKAYDLDRRSDSSDAFAAAVELAESGESSGAIAALQELRDVEAAGYGGLAAFKEAELKLAAGDRDGAIALWNQLAAGTALGQGYRDVATLLAVLHQIGTADAAGLRERLQPLTQPGRAFRAQAVELIALLHLESGDREAAEQRYQEVADDATAPAGVRGRAAEMLQAIAAPR